MNYLPYLSLLVAASMFFALMSNSLRRYSIARLEDRLRELGRIELLVRFLEQEDALILTASVWRLLSNVAFVFLVAFEIRHLDPLRAVAVAALAALALLIFGATVPLAWARYGSERLIARCMRAMFLLRVVTSPLLAFLKLFDGLVRRLSGAPDSASRDDDLEDELRSVVKEGELEGTLEEEEKEMIESIIEFRDTDVAQIMTPRTDMLCLPRDATLPEARRFIQTSGHSRVPVFEDTLDVIVGVLYAKDLLAATAEPRFQAARVADIMRTPLFVPETKNLTDLLRDFQRTGIHIAIVLDEYGGTAGLLTIEDIIEEIVGEIADEYDESPAQEIRKVSESLVEIDARTRIADANDKLGIALPDDEDYETVGGFVLSRFGYIPKPGEKLEYRGLTVSVLEADERKVKRLRIDGLDRFIREQD